LVIHNTFFGRSVPKNALRTLDLISVLDLKDARVSVGGGTAERLCVGQKFSAQEFLINSPDAKRHDSARLRVVRSFQYR